VGVAWNSSVDADHLESMGKKHDGYF